MVLLQKVVHKKYTRRDGKKYGPYFYSTQRKDGRVVTNYLGKDVVVMKRPEWRFMLVVAGMVFAFLVLLLYLSYGDFLTGRVSLDIDSSYIPGEVVGGYLHLNLKHGELIPADSLVIANLGEASGIYTLGQILGSSSSSGVFYLEDQNLFGDGLGYGVPGVARAYPNVSFVLEVSSEEFEEVIIPEVESEEVIGNETIEEIVGNESSDSEESSGDLGEESSSDSEEGSSEEGSSEEPSDENLGEETGEESSSGSDEESDSEESSNEGGEDFDSGSGDSGDSADSGEESSDSADSGGSAESSDSGITGEAISEESFTVEGIANRDSDFSYALESGQSARIVPGSVTVNGESVPDAALELDISSNLVIVSTTYSIEVEGFGAEFLGDEIVTFDIPLSGFGLVALADSNLGVNIEYNGESLVSAERDISTVAPPETNITLENVTIEVINESIGANIILVQEGARLGVPVKWTKTISLDNPSEIIVELPADASNVGVVSFESSDGDSGATIRVDNEGEISEEFSVDEEDPVEEIEEGGIVEDSSEGIIEEDFTPERETILTGNVVSDPSISVVESALTTEVVIEQPISEAVIEYETPAPYSIERDIENGKEILIVGHDSIHYQNVIAFSTIPEEWNVRSQAGLSVYWVESGIVVASSLADGDENGIYDYIEWVAPELSNQTFIIEITQASHLNSSREFVSDIYDEVYQLDGNWSETIGEGEYVRVVFERNLTSVNDITIYPRTVSGVPSVEVYDYNGSEILASFNSIVENEYNKVYLVGLGNRTQDTFDLKILNGALEFDHIIDPSGSVTNISSCSFAIVNNNTDYQITNSFSYSGADYCLNISAYNVTIFGNGYTLTGNPNSLGGIGSIGSYNVTINNLVLEAWDLGVYLENTNNSYLSNITIKGAFTTGFILSSSSFNNISNFVIFNTSSTGGDALDISAASAYNRFFNINLTNTTDTAIQVVTSNNIFEQVIVHQSTTGVSFATAAHNNSLLVGNITDSSVSGLSIGVSANGTFSNIHIANPSFIGSRGISITSSSARSNIFTNLTILNFSAQYFRTSVNSVNGTVLDNFYIQNYTFSGNPGAITTFRKPLYGQVYFFRGLNGTGTNLSNDVTIWNNSIIINSTKTDGGTNKTSNITFYNLPTTFTSPVILRDGVTCAICYNFTSLNAGTVIFNTTSGGNYTIYGTLPSDNILPLVYIAYPTNTTYSSVITALNYSVFDANLQACWYSTDLGVTNTTITCGNNVTGLTSSQGSNTWKVYANDSSNNLNSSSVTFSVDSGAPSIDFVSPTETSGVFLTRGNIMINVTASDSSLANITIELFNSTSLVNRTTTITSPNYVNVTGLINGTYYFNATATDTGNNVNSTSTRLVYIDTQKASVSLIAPANNTLATSEGHSFNATFSDNIQLANVTFNLWNSSGALVNSTFRVLSGTSGSVNLSVTLPSQGRFFWNYLGVDNASNRGVGNSNFTILYDSSSPVVYFISPTNTTYSTNSILVYFNASDANGISSYWFYNGSANVTFTPSTPEARPAGTTELRVQTCSAADSMALNSYSGTCDGSYPSASDRLGASDGVTEDQTYGFTGGGTKYGGVSISVSNNSITNCGAIQSVKLCLDWWVDGDTENLFGNAVEVDASGGGSFSSVSFDAPTTSSVGLVCNDVTSLESWSCNSFFETSGTRAQARNKVSDLAITSVLHTDALFFNVTYSVGVSANASQGSNTWVFYANDSTNNMNSSFVTFSVDSIAPTLNLVYPTNTSYTSLQTALNYSVGTNVQACWYSLDLGVTNTTITCGTNVTGLTSSQGSNTWRVYANNSVNQLNSSSVTFSVDSLAPAVTINLPANVTYTTSSLSFNVSLSENGSAIYSLNNGIGNYTLTENQGLFGTSFNASNSSIADGAYTFRVYANDTAGNRNNTIHVNFSVENLNLLACGTLDRANTEYTLGQSITTTETCFSITAENITLNGAGYSITGDQGASDYGVYSEKYNTSVKNLVVAAFGAGGVYYNLATNSSINNVTSNSNLYGFRLVSSNGSIVSNLLLNSSTQYGLIITYSKLISVSHLNVYEPSAVAGIYIGGERITLLGINTTLGQSDKVISTALLTSGLILNSSNIYGAGTSQDLNLGVNSNVTLIIDTPIKKYSFDDSGSVLTIVNRTSGEIAFLSLINGSGDNLYSEVYTRINLGFINVSNSGLNKSANLTLYSMPSNFSDPVVLRNGALCSGCYNFTSLNVSTVIFNVSSGGSYSVGERPDVINPLISFGIGTENDREFMSNLSLYVNISLTEANLANVTFSFYNSSSVVNRTTFNSATYTFNLTNVPAGIYTYEVNATDSLGNTNGTGVLTARLVSSCLGLCSESSSCSITGNSCYLYSELCTGNVCDFTNLTLQNSTIFTLYNGSGDGNSLVLNITSNSSNSISFIKATGGYTGFVFGGKNGTTIGSGSRGGHGGVLNITTRGLFNRTQANFTGRGGYATSGAGGNGSIIQVNYHGLIGGAYTAATWSGRVNVTGGKSNGGTAGTNGPSPIRVKDSVCPLDADVDNNGFIDDTDSDTIKEVYNNVTGDSTFNSAYDINCDGKLNVIDIAKIGIIFNRSS